MTKPKRRSIVQFMDEDSSTCGYCRSDQETSMSSGMWCHALTVEEYQSLVDRGWRRSGCWVYKPNMQCTCCPQYAIRLDVNKFTPSKEQKRVLRKWDKFLAGAALPAGQTQERTAQAATARENYNDKLLSPDKRQKLDKKARAAREPGRGQQLQQDQSQKAKSSPVPQEGQASDAGAIQQLLEETLQACMASGQLPHTTLPQVKVVKPSARQVGKLQEGVVLSSPVAQAVAGHYRRTQGKDTLSADLVAQTLADAMNSRLAQQAWQDKHGTWTASPLRGHINFCCSSLPDSVSVTSHDPTDAQPHATPADDLISKATQGNLAEPWTGQDLRLSLQAAIADKDLTATVQAASTQQPAGVSVHTATPAGTPAGSAAVPVIATAPGATAAVLSANKGAAVASVADNAATGAKRLQGPNAAVADPDTAPTTAAATPDGLKAGANISNANRDARHSSSGTAAAVNGGREGLDGSAVAQPTRVAAAASASNAESGSNTASGQARRLEIRLVPASLELIPVEFPLFKKYQMNNHGDKPGKVTKQSFQRFLIDSPFGQVPCDAFPAGQSPSCGMGTFHQQYWLDGKLIAVAVLDILPHALSSKYFFWDSDYAALSPGKISALKEVEWVQTAAQQCPALHYYYMGYYIHSCHKMRYKADYEPSDLLCPERLCWIPFQRVKSALDETEYQVLSDVPGAADNLGPEHGLTGQQMQQWATSLSSAEVPEHVLQASLIYSPDLVDGLMRFKDLHHFGASQDVCEKTRTMLKEWHRLVGPAAADMVFLI